MLYVIQQRIAKDTFASLTRYPVTSIISKQKDLSNEGISR